MASLISTGYVPTPALKTSTAVVRFFDGPGTRTLSVIDAMSRYLATSNANAHGAATSRRTDELIGSARKAVADFLG